MPEPVTVLFKVGGIDEVRRSVVALGRDLDRFAVGAQRSGERSVRSRVSAEQRAAKESAAAVDRAERDKLRAVERANKQKIAIQNASFKMEQAAREREARAVEKTERDKTRAIERAAKQRTAIQNSSFRYEQTLREKATREEEKRSRAFASNTRGILGRGIGRVTGIGGAIAGTVATLGGGFAIADALQAGVKHQAMAGQIVRSAQTTGGETGASVLDKAHAAAIGVGSTTEDMLGGLDAFVRKTGDLQQGVEMLGDLAKMAAAGGASLEDMGSTAAEVFQQLGNAGDTKDVMLALMAQGKSGAIDVRDLGQYGARLASSAKQYQGSAKGNIETFGALAQIAKAKGGATDAAEATEAIARIQSDLTSHADKYKKVTGKDVFTDKSQTKMRGVEDLLVGAVTGSKGNLSQLSDIFGERSIKAVKGLQVAYTEAGGGDKGTKAVRELISGAKTTMSMGDVNAGVKDKLTETQSRLNVAMENFHEKINGQLLPKLPGLVDSFSKLAPTMARFAEALASTIGYLAENPAKGIGIALAASVAYEVGKAGLAKILETALTSAASRVMGASGGGGGGGGLGKAGAALAIAAAAVTITAAGVSIINKAFEAGNEQKRQQLAGELATMTAVTKGAHGDPEAARKRLGEVQAQIAIGQSYKNQGVFDKATTGLKLAAGYVTGGKTSTAPEQAAAAALESLKAQAAELTTALGLAAAAASELGNTGGRGNPNDEARKPVGGS